MKQLKYVLIEFLETMLSDLKRRSFDESGEQKDETKQRIETLSNLIKELKRKK